MKNEMNEIPTPETDEPVPTQGNKQTMLQYIEALEAHARDLERRLTIAREDLRGVHETSSSSRLRRVAKEVLTQTTPKP